MSGRYDTLKTELEFPSGEQWLSAQAVKNSESNAKQKRIALEQFDEFLTAFSLDLDDVDNDVLEHFSIWLDNERGMAHGTIRHRWYGVRSYLNDHFDPDVGYIDDPDHYILEWLDKMTKTVDENDTDVHWLPQDVIEDLIAGAKNLKNKLVVALLWHTGCRPSELARLKCRRVNREQRSIKVKTSKVEDEDADNYERTVFWGRSLEPMMREWLDYGGRDSYPFSGKSPYLIVGYNTPSIGPRQINKIVRMAAKAAEIQEDMIETSATDDDGNPVKINRLTPKALRHSFAVHSVRGREQSGTPPMDLERLRRLMGHSSLDTTRRYLQYRTSDLKIAHDTSHPG